VSRATAERARRYVDVDRAGDDRRIAVTVGDQNGTSPPAAAGVDACVDVVEFVARVGRALRDASVARRLGESGIVVRIDVAGDPPASATLLLDRTPAEVMVGPPAYRESIRLRLAGADLAAFWRHDVSLPLKILSGEITYEGQVRRLLRVMPTLRAAIIAGIGD
jgi:hypothetical protein